MRRFHRHLKWRSRRKYVRLSWPSRQAGNTQGVDRIVDFDVQGRDVLEFTGYSPIVEYTCCSTRLTMQDQETVAQRTLRIGAIVAVAILLAAIQHVVS